jgi:hypothetical protein
MQECCTCGSVRGAISDGRPYRNTWTVSAFTMREWVD